MTQKNIRKVLLMGVVLAAICVFAYIMWIKPADPKPSQSNTTIEEEASTIAPSMPNVHIEERVMPGFYENSYLQIEYPIEYKFFIDVCFKDCDSYHTEGTSDLIVGVHVEVADGMSCHFGLCDIPSRTQVTFNGITWDYLGLQGYGDAGRSSTFYAYRTVHEGRGYYVSFSTEGTKNEAIMRTVVLKSLK